MRPLVARRAPAALVDRHIDELERALTAPRRRPLLGFRVHKIPLPWLRDGMRPFLVFLDVISMCVAALALIGLSPTVALFVVTMLALCQVNGMYRSRLSLSILDDAPRLAACVLAAGALTAIATTALGWQDVGDDVVQRRAIGYAALALLILLAARAGGYAVVRGLRRSGVVGHRTVVLGAGRVGTHIAESLRDHPEYGLRPVGFLDSDPLMPTVDGGFPLLGGHGELSEVLRRHDVRALIVAFTSLPSSDMVDVIRTSDRMQCEIFIVPRLFEVHHVSRDMDNVWGVPVMRLQRAPYRTQAWRLKRAVDVAFSAVALLLLSPLLAVLATGVRLEGGPGVLFRQHRIGVDGREFELLKFRSMKPVDGAEAATRWNIAEDDRIGWFGKLLRKSSLDELPQLLNILRGDMSLVGPRPERPHFVMQFGETYPRYVARHRVPSGLTGWAQVHGLRGDTSIEDRARFDNYYIENWSLWLDVKILIRTVTSVVSGAGG